MGQAITRTLLAAGHRITVWNRTPSRADTLVAEGAILAQNPAEALKASSLVILSLTDSQAMYDVLRESADALLGRTLVNLSSESPAGTREAAEWVHSHGAALVVGGIMVPAPIVGTEHSTVFYSGTEQAFVKVERVVAHLGAPQYLGEDPALAQLLYQAHLCVFLTALSGLCQATALLANAGLSASETMPGLLAMIRTTPDLDTAGGDPALWQMVDSGEHPGDLSTAAMMGGDSRPYRRRKRGGRDRSDPAARRAKTLLARARRRVRAR